MAQLQKIAPGSSRTWRKYFQES